MRQSVEMLAAETAALLISILWCKFIHRKVSSVALFVPARRHQITFAVLDVDEHFHCHKCGHHWIKHRKMNKEEKRRSEEDRRKWKNSPSKQRIDGLLQEFIDNQNSEFPEYIDG